MPATVKLCLRGGDCEAKCLRSFSHEKSYRVSFRFTPKLSDQVVFITEESDFYTRYCRNKLHDSKIGKNGGLQICRYSNSCRYSRCSLKMGSTVFFLYLWCARFFFFSRLQSGLSIIILGHVM